MSTFRTIIESEETKAVLELARSVEKRFEEGWQAWTWRLAQNPFKGAFHYRDNLYMIKSHEVFRDFGLPITTLLFKIPDDDHIEIIAVKVESKYFKKK